MIWAPGDVKGTYKTQTFHLNKYRHSNADAGHRIGKPVEHERDNGDGDVPRHPQTGVIMPTISA
jgi:hypothetical protein